MGAIKLNSYSQEHLRNAEIGRAIGAPARIVILKYLKEHPSVCGNDLKNVLALSKATIQQHLSTLVQSGLVRTEYINNDFVWTLNSQCQQEIEHLSWIFE